MDKTNLRLRIIAWVAVGVLTALYASRHVAIYMAEPGRLHANDFKHLYLGAVFVGAGGNPYDDSEFLHAATALSRQDPRFRSILPYVYLPFTGIVLLPLTWLPRFGDAVWAWFWINQILFLGGGWLAARAVGLPRRSAVLALVLFLLVWNQPLDRTLTAGQLNAVLLFAYALVLWMTPRAPAWATGAAAAFAAMFKLSPGILFFWFLAERRRREAAWMAVFCLLFLAASFPLAGPRTHAAFLPVLREMGYGKSTWAAHGQHFFRDPYNQSMNSFYHHAFAKYQPPAGLPGDGIRPWADLGVRAANTFTILDTLALVLAAAWLVWPFPQARKTTKDTASANEAPASAGDPKGHSTSDADNPQLTTHHSPLTTHNPQLTTHNSPSLLPLDSVMRYAMFVTLSLLIPSLMWDHYVVQLVIVYLALARLFVERRVGLGPQLIWAAIIIVNGSGIALDAPEFQSGAGILAMSTKLWATLAVWFLVAWSLLRLRQEKRESAAGEPPI